MRMTVPSGSCLREFDCRFGSARVHLGLRVIHKVPLDPLEAQKRPDDQTIIATPVEVLIEQRID